MKVLTRDFTKREKVLLVVLLLIILCFVYYLVVFEPISNSMTNLNSEIQMLEDQLVVTDAKAEQIRNMQLELDAIEEAQGTVSYMPSYNASKAELDFLNTTLASTSDYYVGFTGVSREGEQIRRDFSLQFVSADYSDAVNIVNELEQSNIRCVVRDLAIKPSENEGTLTSGSVDVSCVATFFETMHDGIPDQELPPDTAPQEIIEDDE